MRFLWMFVVLAGCSGGGGGGGPATVRTALPLEATSLEFGQALPGNPVTRTLLIRNPDDGLPARVTGLQTDAIELDLLPPTLPAVIQPGDRISVEVTWTPDAEGFFSSLIRVESDDRSPLVIGVSGTGFASETVVDFGLVALDAQGETPELAVQVPADAISITLEAWGGTRSSPTGGRIHIHELTGPGGRVYVDPSQPFSGPYWFDRNYPADTSLVPVDLATFLVPNTDAAAVQLVPGGGTYTFVMSNSGGFLTDLNVRATIERRMSASDATRGHIDLNVFIAAGLSASAGNAASSPHLQSILARADNILGSVGLGFGAIDYYKLTNPVFDFGNPFDPSALFRQSAMARETRLNVFLVVSSSNGVAGLTGALPGPRVLGSPTAGIFVIGDENIMPDDLGTVLAHEIGHALGLGHTREALGLPWLYDRIEDTCPGTNCVGDPTLYLMDTSAIPPGTPYLTPGQARVMRGHLFVDPGSATFTPGAVFTTSPLLAEGARLSGATCANCAGR